LWIEETYRLHNYPATEWYTGFAQDRVSSGANIAGELKVIERNAQNSLAESIVVTVSSTSLTKTESAQWQSGTQMAEVSTMDYRQAIGTATTATTVKTETKSYYNPSTGAIYAFASVRRSDLAAFYARQIDVDLNKAEVAVEVARQLMAAGKKMSAYRKVEEARQTLAGIGSYRDLLVAVDAGTDESRLQSARGGELQRTVEQLLIDLEQSTFVYIDSSGDGMGIFSDILAAALSENGCSIVESPDEADYELTLSTSTAMRSDGSGNYGIISYYANVKGTLYNRRTQKRVTEFSILNDPDAYSAGRSAEDAAAKAFRLPELKNKVLSKILPRISN
jgi:hypothetical protein